MEYHDIKSEIGNQHFCKYIRIIVGLDDAYILSFIFKNVKKSIKKILLEINKYYAYKICPLYYLFWLSNND